MKKTKVLLASAAAGMALAGVMVPFSMAFANVGFVGHMGGFPFRNSLSNNVFAHNHLLNQNIFAHNHLLRNNVFANNHLFRHNLMNHRFNHRFNRHFI